MQRQAQKLLCFRTNVRSMVFCSVVLRVHRLDGATSGEVEASAIYGRDLSLALTPKKRDIHGVCTS